MKINSKEAIALKDTTFLGSTIDGDVKYFFYKARSNPNASVEDISNCLKLRYMKYGEVSFQQKQSEASSEDDVIFTVMEAIRPSGGEYV